MTYFIITFAVFFVISIFGLIAAGYKKKDKDQNQSHMIGSEHVMHRPGSNPDPRGRRRRAVAAAARTCRTDNA